MNNWAFLNKQELMINYGVLLLLMVVLILGLYLHSLKIIVIVNGSTHMSCLSADLQ